MRRRRAARSVGPARAGRACMRAGVHQSERSDMAACRARRAARAAAPSRVASNKPPRHCVVNIDRTQRLASRSVAFLPSLLTYLTRHASIRREPRNAVRSVSCHPVLVEPQPPSHPLKRGRRQRALTSARDLQRCTHRNNNSKTTCPCPARP